MKTYGVMLDPEVWEMLRQEARPAHGAARARRLQTRATSPRSMVTGPMRLS